ncbi:putative RNA-directed DNA polymerase [Helianthus annuus]|nr:putative RNA-directed DNA polymerase [Helianthus annuus]
MDWFRNLRIVLKQEKISYVLDDPIPDQPDEEDVEAYNDWVKYTEDSMQASCLMLGTMIPEIQKDFEHHGAYDMITQLKEMFLQQARVERFETVRALHACRMEETQSVSSYVLKMKSHIDRLERLNCPVSKELATDLILNSLTKKFESFVMNYNMNGWDKSIGELHAMLKTAEAGMGKKALSVLTINEGGKKGHHPDTKANVAKGKGHIKGKGKRKAKAEPPKPKEKKAKVATSDPCFECGEIGHWKRNCPTYLKELKNKRDAGQTSDTGCGTHICNSLQGFKRNKHYKKGDTSLFMGNGAKVQVEAQGDYILKLPSGLEICLKNVLYAPSLTRNIISVSLLRQYGFDFKFVNNEIYALMNDMFYFKATSSNGIYELVHDNTSFDNSMYQANTKKLKMDLSETYLWHCRLGHINRNRMQTLQKNGLLETNEIGSFDTCESCLQGKMTKKPFSGTNQRAKDLLGIIHSDVCGPFKPMTRNGERYFVTFTDDFSRYGYVYLLSHKDEVFETFKIFQNEVENQLTKTIKVLRSDRGGEYLSDAFQDHLRSCGIISQLTPPGTPQHNGVSERRNRTLLDMVRSMMARSTLPLSFWGYALLSAARILNMAPTKKVDKTPFEIWHGTVPSLSYLKVWGCDAYVKQYTPNKLEVRSIKCIFVGYPKDDIGYYFYDPTEQKVFVARKGKFLEDKFLMEGTNRTVELDEDQGPQPNTRLVDTSTQQEVVEYDQMVDQHTHNVRRSGRISNPPERYGFFMDGCYVVDSDEPTTYHDAMSKSDCDKWLEAMNVEMQSMYDNQVWELVVPPLNSKVVGSKWVFKKKTDMHGNLDTYKARLVAKGFTQTQGVDYDETFSPVAMLKSIRILFAIAEYYDYEIWQMDVKTAFLNGYLDEDVYMVQPEGFVDPKHPNKVCKLKKSIYGLKQASRSWNHRFDEEIRNFGFIKNGDEACVYKKASGSTVTFLVLYVDDILLFGNDIPTMEGVKAWLGRCFSIKDLGEAAYILGIKIYRDRSRRLIGLNQSAYIDKVLKRFKMENSKKGLVPIQKGTILNVTQCPSSKDEQERMKGIPYASAIGSIMYAMICTRPDVSCALSMTSRYQQNPGNSHWMAVKSILKYLRRTKDMFLIYGSGEEELVVKGYTDASFQTDRDGSRSQSGYVFILNGAAVSWKSSKQDVVALSTTESEYIAASLAAQEAAWLKKFIADLGVVPTIQDPLEIFCDNEGAIAQIKEPRAHQKTRHIERRFNYIRDEVEKGKICIRKVHTDQNIADPLTKLLERPKHEGHTCALGLRYSSDWI